MKTINKIFIAITLSIFSISLLNAQTFNYPVKNAKRLVIKNMLGKMKLEAVSGNEIQVEASHFSAPPKRADGLKELYGDAEDNSGIGLAFQEIDNAIYLSGASKQSSDATYTIKVPNSVALEIDYSSPFVEADNITFENFQNEISAKSLQAGFIFNNITGPVTASTINGDIVATFKNVNQESPISLSSINGIVDVSLPGNTPANIELSTIDGTVYTDFDIDFTKKTSSKNNNYFYIGGGARSKGTINNGGVIIKLNSINDDIYLRKK